MIDHPCTQMRRWLDKPYSSALPDPALSAHVAACPHCRGVLVGLAADLVVALPQYPPSCAALAEDLLAYVELEHAQGEMISARRYPAVWWHLWTCPDCALLAEDLALLLTAEAAGELEAPPLLRRNTPVPTAAPLARASLRIAQDFLHAFFAPQHVMGATWNGDDDQLFLVEETILGCHLVIHVQRERSDHWALEVSVEPPVAGVLVVRFAETVFRATFDGGIARLGGIPAPLLLDRSEPDLLLTIERETGHPCERGS